MTDSIVIALISSGSGVVGAFAKVGFDKVRASSHETRGPDRRNGNGNGVESVIARREEIAFQARMTLLMEGLTNAIERGHDKALQQMTVVGEAINDAAGAMREVRSEIVGHRAETAPTLQATLDTARLVREIHQKVVG